MFPQVSSFSQTCTPLPKLLLRGRFSGFLARKTHTTAKIQVPVGQQGTDGQFINCKTAINSSAYTKFQSSKSQWIDDHKLSYKYDTADTKSQNHFVEKRERIFRHAENTCSAANSGGRGTPKFVVATSKYLKIYNCRYLRNIPISPLTRTQSSGPCRQNRYFYLFRDATACH